MKIFLLVGLLVCFGSAGAADWVYIGNSDEHRYELNIDSISSAGNYLYPKAIKAWFKQTIHTDLTKDGMTVGDHYMVLSHIDCESGKMGRASDTAYKKGKVFGNSYNTQYPTLVDVVPDTVGEAMLKAACNPTIYTPLNNNPQVSVASRTEESAEKAGRAFFSNTHNLYFAADHYLKNELLDDAVNICKENIHQTILQCLNLAAARIRLNNDVPNLLIDHTYTTENIPVSVFDSISFVSDFKKSSIHVPQLISGRMSMAGAYYGKKNNIKNLKECNIIDNEDFQAGCMSIVQEKQNYKTL